MDYSGPPASSDAIDATAASQSPFRETHPAARLGFSSSGHSLPADVGNFLLNLYKRIADRDLEGLRRLYEIEFNLLSDQHYAVCPWPDTETVINFYEKNGYKTGQIELFYNELTDRHMYSKCKEALTMEARKKSWENYVSLFTSFVEEECQGGPDLTYRLTLPSQWVWDMFDELMYQFSDNCRWKCHLAAALPSDPTEQEAHVAVLKESQEIWLAAEILQILHQLVDSSEILEHLKRSKNDSSRTSQSNLDLRHQLGYYAMIALLRMYTILGEYTMAIQSVSEIEASPRSFYTKTPSCHSAFCYYLGFCFAMLRRYGDAIRVFSQLLLTLGKQRNAGHSGNRLNVHVSKQIDRVYMLAMLCDLLASARMDDFIVQTFKERYADKYAKAQLDNLDAIHDIFVSACPKFANAAFASFDSIQTIKEYSEVESERQKQQIAHFMKGVIFQRRIAELQSFAKLYNNVQLSKLASFMNFGGKNPTELMKAEALAVKHKARQFVWSFGPQLTGELTPAAPTFDFYLDGDVMHVKSLKTQKIYAEDFARYLNRSQELLHSIQNSNLNKE